MKQSTNLADRWVNSGLLRAFVDVARETDQAQIIWRRWSSRCFRYNMINMHP